MKVKNMLKILPAALLVAGMGSNAMAADGKALFTAKGCVACHGADGNTPIMPVYPKIAGQNKDYAVQQMKDIKSGARANGQSMAMKAIMASVSDEETAAIAEWLAGGAK